MMEIPLAIGANFDGMDFITRPIEDFHKMTSGSERDFPLHRLPTHQDTDTDPLFHDTSPPSSARARENASNFA
jgi:hypothetical protein